MAEHTSAPALSWVKTRNASVMAARFASRIVVTSKPRRPSAPATSAASFPGFGSVPIAAYAPLPPTACQ